MAVSIPITEGRKPEPEAPWYSPFPAPRNTQPATLSKFEVLQCLHRDLIGKDFILIDLRRMDHEGGTIHGSINIPAQSLYHSIPTLYSSFASANVEKIIWYCGSSRGRGTRAAGWFDDYIQDKGDARMKSYTLAEGIKGWVCAGKEYTQLMDGYKEEFWLR